MTKDEQKQLKPTLSLLDATAISIGAIIGGGIFVVTGIAAGIAGSAVVISILIAAVIASLTALSFAELSAWQPVEGSVYEYTRRLVSPFTGFLTGWMWLVSNTFGGAAVSLGFAYYFTETLPIAPPKILAAIVCLFFTALNYAGVRKSAILNNFLVLIKLFILVFFVIYGIFFVKTTNFEPFLPLQKEVLFGTYFMFFAYGGFARVAVIGEEVKNAKQTVPKAILLSLAISTIIYIFVGLVAVGLVGSNALKGSESPLTLAIGSTGNPWAQQIVSAGALVATASVLLTAVLGVSRMAFSMARQKDLPTSMCKVHQRFGTPYISIWIVGTIMVLLVLLVDLREVVTVSTFTLLFTYCFANISATKLKNKKRLYPKILSFLGLFTCLILMVVVCTIATSAWVAGTIFLVIGTVYYYMRKKLKNKQKKSKASLIPNHK
ncbi:MAG: APC family permease [Candidatus Bathyarchaeota archaeon]|nr:APC family permease [Candidatus Bathyarchaeota archaeon]